MYPTTTTTIEGSNQQAAEVKIMLFSFTTALVSAILLITVLFVSVRKFEAKRPAAALISYNNTQH